MSFQGDVGGIGLAELLQSLARGRREGVLRLHTREGLSCILGLENGVVSFLPDEDEDSNIWKERSRQAWIHDQDFRIDAMRMSDIARAHRIERVYQILDSEGVHFRFNPGEAIRTATAPVRESTGDKGPNQARAPEVYCDGSAIEMFLLEYARLTDEAEGLAGNLDFTDYIVPRATDPAAAHESGDRFLTQCDGITTLAEISDRLGYPIRQARLVFAAALRAGDVRLAGHRELLVLSQKELSQGHVRRAAARLVGWIQASPPGALEEGDAELLAAEFKADRMGPLLNLMPSREARILLRRVDHTVNDAYASVRHWRELQRLKRKDLIIEVHRLGAEFRWEDDDETPNLRELLDAAKDLREDGHPARAGAFLRMAASREPANANSRLDIGLGMIAADMIEEGAAWILDGAQTLVAAGQASKAIPALRALIEADGSIREARRMLGRLRHLTVRRQHIRKNFMIGLGIAAVLGSVGWVRVSMERARDLKLDEIANLMGTPSEANALLEAYFPEDDSPRIAHLRGLITDRQQLQESEWRGSWHEKYREAQLACSLGDALEGLKLALGMRSPPVLITINEPWPLISDLFNGLAVRLENDFAALGDLELEGQVQVNNEAEVKGVVDGVLDHLGELEGQIETGDLQDRCEVINRTIIERTVERSRLLEERAAQNLLEKQDLMLASARAHDRAGNLETSLQVFQNLIDTDETGRLGEILAEEREDVLRRFQALEGARKLASEGRHEEALEVLGSDFREGSVYALPWTFEVFPPGAQVHLTDGSTRQVPFIYMSRPGERVEFFVDYPEHIGRTIVIENPGDISISLAKVPHRTWNRGGRVDSFPVNVGGDQVVCDRTGHVARIAANGETVWELELLSLGGIGRAPVFMPERPDHLLLITEDGETWIIHSETGEIDGPYSLKSGPVEGPSATPSGVLARLKDGRLVKWKRRLRPTTIKKGNIPEEDRHGALGGLSVLHRGEAGRHSLECPWTEWRVDLLTDMYRVYKEGEPESGFTVQRDGDWSYLAWEAPNEALPEGRLWISDGAGLSAYLP